jgi:hypothetical protein
MASKVQVFTLEEAEQALLSHAIAELRAARARIVYLERVLRKVDGLPEEMDSLLVSSPYPSSRNAIRDCRDMVVRALADAAGGER